MRGMVFVTYLSWTAPGHLGGSAGALAVGHRHVLSACRRALQVVHPPEIFHHRLDQGGGEQDTQKKYIYMSRDDRINHTQGAGMEPGRLWRFKSKG